MTKNYLNFIADALAHAAIIAKEKFGKVEGKTKPGDTNQVLTQADLAIGDYIVKEISRLFPQHNVIDEEKGVINKSSLYTWVIDPIDGTSNFANSLPHYAIMLGLLEDNIPVAGGVMLPFFEQLYLAEKGSGALCNGEKISVTSETNLLNTLVAIQIDGHQNDPDRTRRESKIIAELVLNVRNIRDSGSVYDSMMVACGKYGGYVSVSGRIWDNVAQQIIIQEAGGVYTDFWGEPINYSNALQRSNETFTWCAAAPSLHKKLQDVIHSLQ